MNVTSGHHGVIDRSTVRVVMALAVVLAVSTAGAASANAVQLSEDQSVVGDADAGWYLAQASAVWAVANDDPVGYGLAVASMFVVAAGAASTGVGLVV